MLKARTVKCWLPGLLLMVTVVAASEPQKFVDENHASFVAGEFDDGGKNFYVSANGTLRSINRFDLNDDGHLDLLFNCTHNTYQMLPATVGTIGPQRQAISLPVEVEGSQQCEIFDLNHDGYSDIVFCPNPIGVHHNRRFVMVAWGGPDGWSARRVNSPLPMDAAATVKICDMNGDGWEDIAALGGQRWLPQQPEGRIIRVYWGSSSGFTVTAFKDFGVSQAVDVASADFDQDGCGDLAALRGDGQVALIWGQQSSDGEFGVTNVKLVAADATCVVAKDVSSDGRPDLILGTSGDFVTIVDAADRRQWQPIKRIPAFPATQLTIADLDRDDHVDLVLTQFGQARAAGGEQAGAGSNAVDQVRILWGAPQGFSNQNVSALDVPIAVATAAGDLDGDGHLDLAIAIHQGKTTFNGESAVFFGDGARHFVRGQTGFGTSGTLHVAIAPPERDLPARAVFCNSIGGELDEAVPLHLYWGGPQGFDPAKVWKIPFHSGYEGSAADLDADGFADLVILNSGHAGEFSKTDPTLGANIIFGGPEGLEKSTRRMVLKEQFLGTSGICDLNRDGFLDLVLEPFGAARAGEKEKLFLYYGGTDGFNVSRRVELTLDGYAQEHLIADLNQDQWPDIAVTSRSLDCVRILWGSPEGFDANRDLRLKIAGPVGVDAADFNGDGWLDLLSASYNDPVSGFRDMGSVIFWGGPDGYQHANAQWLPGFSPLGRTIADFDGDGHLDLFSPQHSGELTREDLACHIYWGSDTGFATRRRTTLYCDSANDSMAGDFNGDGKIDLAVNCHTRHGDHRTLSNVFYNDGNRFQKPTLQQLPTNGPHLIWAEDVGHVYHRKYQHAYHSRVFSYAQPIHALKFMAEATVPAGTKLEFAMRSAVDADGLKEQPWTAITGDTITISPDHRSLQYRALFVSDNGDRYPELRRVALESQK